MASILPSGVSSVAGPPPRLVIADGSLEALKWLSLGLMVLDHVNKFLFGESSAVLFDLGRMVMPLFGFVLMYNLTRPDAVARGIHLRVMRRLLVFGTLATPLFLMLVGWWPLNILFMLSLATGIVWLIERGGAIRFAIASLLFVTAGAFVEFWWFGVLCCLGAWAFCRRPTACGLILWLLATASLWIVNRNFAALAALPLIWGASRVEIPTKRCQWLFYGAYPAHLAVIWSWQLFG